MTNEEVMQLMTDMGLHEGGIENWVMDNAWVLVVNKAIEKEREACIAHAMTSAEKAIDVAIKLEREACAKLCDRYTDSCSDHEAGTAMNIQDAIRARGNHD